MAAVAPNTSYSSSTVAISCKRGTVTIVTEHIWLCLVGESKSSLTGIAEIIHLSRCQLTKVSRLGTSVDLEILPLPTFFFCISARMIEILFHPNCTATDKKTRIYVLSGVFSLLLNLNLKLF